MLYWSIRVALLPLSAAATMYDRHLIPHCVRNDKGEWGSVAQVLAQPLLSSSTAASYVSFQLSSGCGKLLQAAIDSRQDSGYTQTTSRSPVRRKDAKEQKPGWSSRIVRVFCLTPSLSLPPGLSASFPRASIAARFRAYRVSTPRFGMPLALKVSRRPHITSYELLWRHTSWQDRYTSK
jgi:hypothetical protein